MNGQSSSGGHALLCELGNCDDLLCAAAANATIFLGDADTGQADSCHLLKVFHGEIVLAIDLFSHGLQFGLSELLRKLFEHLLLSSQ